MNERQLIQNYLDEQDKIRAELRVRTEQLKIYERTVAILTEDIKRLVSKQEDSQLVKDYEALKKECHYWKDKFERLAQGVRNVISIYL